MSKKLMIKCDEATSICDKNQYNEASFFDKIRLAIHNFLCHRCKLYSKQNSIITRVLNVHNTHLQEEVNLEVEEKEKLRKILDSELKKMDR